MPAVAVIGASTDRAKFGNKAVRAYAAQGWTVYPIHPDGECPRAARIACAVPSPLLR